MRTIVKEVTVHVPNKRGTHSIPPCLKQDRQTDRRQKCWFYGSLARSGKGFSMGNVAGEGNGVKKTTLKNKTNMEGKENGGKST